MDRSGAGGVPRTRGAEPGVALLLALLLRVPRTRGAEPNVEEVAALVQRCSPHTRG